MENRCQLKLEHISKSFYGVYALNDVSMEFQKGEICALVGENGAGKSTMIKIITGVYSKDSGKIILDGQTISPTDSLNAQRLGISTVYQELNLSPFLSLSENIFLGHEFRNKFGFIDWEKTHSEAKKLLDNMGIKNVDVRKPLQEYSTAIQQMISIARALTIEAKLLIMDEPTSSLDAGEVKILFREMRRLKEMGITILFVTHKMDEIFQICDSAVVLKDGMFVGRYDIKDLDYDKLLSSMIGRDASGLLRRKETYDLQVTQAAPVVCSLRGITKTRVLSDVDLDIHAGEVVGLAGLLGSGRTELARIIVGADQMYSGEVQINGETVHFSSPKDAISRRIAYCPEDRKKEGIFAQMSVLDNMTMTGISEMSSGGVVRVKRQRAVFQDYQKKMAIKTATSLTPIQFLSGGNQQKVILSREVSMNPQLIVLDEPTRGIDVGAKAEIEKIISQLAAAGIAVLFISSELEELVRRCDRVAVLYEGKKIRELVGEEISKESILDAIAEGGRQSDMQRDATEEAAKEQ